MSEIYISRATQPAAGYAGRWEWFKLASVSNAKKIRLSVYHKSYMSAYWGDLSHEYDEPYSGDIMYFLGGRTIREESTANHYGTPWPLVNSPGESDVLFIKWKTGDSISMIQYWSFLQAEVQIKDIVVSLRSTLVPEPEDPEYPEWEELQPLNGRFVYMIFQYNRGSEYIPDVGTELFGTVYDGTGERAGVVVTGRAG